VAGGSGQFESECPFEIIAHGEKDRQYPVSCSLNPIRDDKAIRYARRPISRIEAEQASERKLRRRNRTASMFEEIVGSSPSPCTRYLSLFQSLPQTPRPDHRRNGDGQRAVARAVTNGRTVLRECSSASIRRIPRDLIASELFGHEKAPSQGRRIAVQWRFELAEGGRRSPG